MMSIHLVLLRNAFASKQKVKEVRKLDQDKVPTIKES